MSKYFYEVAKKFSGDTELAARYMGMARKLLGGLKEISGDVYQNSRSVLLPDGARISVSFFGGMHQVAIDVRGVGSERQERICNFGFVYTPTGGDFAPSYEYDFSVSSFHYPGIRLYTVTFDDDGEAVFSEVEPAADTKPHILKTSASEYPYSGYAQFIDLVNPLPADNYVGKDDFFYSADNYISGCHTYAVVPYSWVTRYAPGRQASFPGGNQIGRHGQSAPYMNRAVVENRPSWTEDTNFFVIARDGKYYALLAESDIPGEGTLTIQGVSVFDGRLVVVGLSQDGVNQPYPGLGSFWHWTLSVFISTTLISRSEFITGFELIGEMTVNTPETSVVSIEHALPVGPGLVSFRFNESGNQGVSPSLYMMWDGPPEWGPGTNIRSGHMFRRYIDITATESLSGEKGYAATFKEEGAGDYGDDYITIADYIGDREVWYTKSDNTNTGNLIKKWVNGAVVQTYSNGDLNVLDARFELEAFHPHAGDYVTLYGGFGVAASKTIFLAVDPKFYTGDKVDINDPIYANGYARFGDKVLPLDYLGQLAAQFPDDTEHEAPSIQANRVVRAHGVGLIGGLGVNK